jgi:(p)ppGpp synthase/HD superfamily hydrolase
MFTGGELAAMITDVFQLHQNFPKKPQNAFRKFDGATPYGVHPTFMAMMILQEDTMEENDRVRRAKALLGHDLLEDTTAPLPEWCKDFEVLALIDGLTFTNDQDPLTEIWNRGDEVILVKFYDNVANLMNTRMMTSERREERRQHVLEHLAWVESRNPQLEIVKIAKGLLGLAPS